MRYQDICTRLINMTQVLWETYIFLKGSWRTHREDTLRPFHMKHLVVKQPQVTEACE